ncbi:hypothetical protein CVS40_9507 [Lucilia cuprina]|nr:hypothetical protein CVS40_9507 [Lucilia cuprina]
MDFFKPLMVTINLHKEKRYGCLFTSLTVRSVNIEIALTTNSCILAIRNFMREEEFPRNFLATMVLILWSVTRTTRSSYG